MESHLEARLWNDIFRCPEALGIPTARARDRADRDVPAAFEMDEILWELREHSAGLNIGRWDYIFSCIKKLRSHRSSASPTARRSR
jgi:malate synthase